MSAVTLVTGSRKGIGRHLVEYYLRAGHSVIGCSRKSSDLRHEKYVHFLADVGRAEDVSALFESVREHFGRLDNLVNNAGAAALNLALVTPPSEAENVVRTNLLGTFFTCQEAARLMVAQGSGRIVNVSSMVVPMELEGSSIYAASKAGVETLTKVLAKELGALGVTVNCVGPGPTATDLIRGISEKKLSEFLARQSIRRETSFDDIRYAVDFFLREESRFVNGQVVYVGGS